MANILPIQFFQPKLVVRNISNPPKDVRVMKVIDLHPGQKVDVFTCVNTDLFKEDDIFRELYLPTGTLFISVQVVKELEILEFDLPSFHYAQAGITEVTPADLQSLGPFSAGAFPVAVDGSNFDWTTPQHPLTIAGSQLSIPPASATQDGYLTKEDWALFAAGSGVSLGLRIWQYQDFTAPLSSAVTITSFQNGTGLAFNPAYIVNDTASLVLLSDTEEPPTTVLTIPGKYIPSNKVLVTSQIGTTVILNQAPHPSLSCRLFYQIDVPFGVNPPAGYEEDPNFVNERELNFLDDFFVNQAGDETIYGIKTFQEVHTAAFQLSTSPNDGYVLTSNVTGFGSWSTIPFTASTPPSTPYAGQTWVNTSSFELFVWDAVRGKWLSPRTIETTAARNSIQATNIYLRTDDNIPTNIAPFVIPFNATLISMSAGGSASQSWIAEVRLNQVLVPGASLAVSASTTAFSSTVNADFSAGDQVQLYLNGTNIANPKVSLIFARRV